MDWSWTNASHMNPACEEGVEQFLEFALERTRLYEDGKYLCPCINCLNGRWQVVDDIWEHFLCDGIKKNYTTWIWHGELTDMQIRSQTKLVDVEVGVRLEDMICDLRQDSFQQAHASMYDILESDSNKPLYPRCKKSLTLLLVVLSLVNVKEKYGWSDKSFTLFLQLC